MRLTQILIRLLQFIELAVGLSSQEESLEIERLNFQEEIHLLDGRLELVNLDVAARAEEIAVLNYLVDCLIFMVQLLIESIYFKHFNRFL